jgi:hypothetical protein
MPAGRISPRARPARRAGRGAAGNDVQPLLASQAREGLAIELEQGLVGAAHDQVGRRRDPRQVRGREIGTAAARDDGAGEIRADGDREQRRGGAGAAPHEAEGQIARLRKPPHPLRGAEEAPRQQADVEAKSRGPRVHHLFLAREQVDPQRAEPAVVQHVGDDARGRAVATAPAGVRDDHEAAGARREREDPFQQHVARRHGDIPLASLHSWLRPCPRLSRRGSQGPYPRRSRAPLRYPDRS